ncbi:MAG: glycosyltransferase family 9 protein [Xanthomonadaceae bacterium]|nr:glycosyltransferase family 9 protein [Xanthomonadaceae bacterium]
MSQVNIKQIQSILVRAPNWIGDQIMAYPFYYSLRQIFPKVHIAVVCTEWVKDIQFQKCVNETFVLPSMKGKSFLEKAMTLSSFSRELKRARVWDLGITLPNSLSSAYMLWRAGVKHRLGYSTEGRGVLLNLKQKWSPDPGIHRAQSYLNLIKGLNLPVISINRFWTQDAPNELDPPIQGVLDLFNAKGEWAGMTPLERPKSDYWVLAPGATADSRRWPTEYFLGLADIIWEKLKIPGVIVGGPSEVKLAQDMMSGRPAEQFIDLTSQGVVSQLAGVFEKAKFSVCNESGLAHVASLCGSPVQIVCGAANPNRTAPTGPARVRVSFNPVDCWPCEKNHCYQPQNEQIKCLRGINPKRVFEEVCGVARIPISS